MKGYVALTTVLVILPLLLVTGIDTLYNNMTTLIVGKMSYDYQILQSNSETCLEETVYKLKRNREYIGEYNISMDTWNCDIEVSNKIDNPGIKVIRIESTDENGTYLLINKELNMNTDPFEISNI
jgi:hypothetical protein